MQGGGPPSRSHCGAAMQPSTGVRHSIPEGRQQLFAMAENVMPAMYMPWLRSTPENFCALFQ